MDNLLQVVIYILIGIIYAIFKARKERQKNSIPQIEPLPSAPYQSPNFNSPKQTLQQKIDARILEEKNKNAKRADVYSKIDPRSSEKEIEVVNYESENYKSEALEFHYREEKPQINPYASSLKNATSLRDAVILSEILKKKYN